MTTGKKASTGKGKVKKLNIKKETIRDLDVKGKATKVKGGGARRFNSDTCPTIQITCTCPRY